MNVTTFRSHNGRVGGIAIRNPKFVAVAALRFRFEMACPLISGQTIPVLTGGNKQRISALMPYAV
jgi:hypothetical protein